jgi:prolyl oligopeptidase
MNPGWLTLLLGITLMTPTRSHASKPPAPPAAKADRYQWLEEVTGKKALDWVRAANAVTAKELEGSDGYRTLERDLLAILDSKAKIPYVSSHGGFLYNLWRDAANPRGLWRRTTREQYRLSEPAWETVLDLDALGKAEGQGWVLHGTDFLRSDPSRCLVSLSPGGSDAVVVREFDVTSKTFVAGGFTLPLGKSSVSWIDRDTLFVGMDSGPGSMTTSGYPRVARRWRRGTPLAQAPVVFEGKAEDMTAVASHDQTPGFERDILYRKPSFFTNELFVLGKDGKPSRIEVQDDAEVDLHREWLTIQLRSPWTVAGHTYPAGALLAADFDAYMAGKRNLVMLFEPTASTSLEAHSWTRNHLILNVMDDVKNRLTVLTPTPAGWGRAPLLGTPEIGTVAVHGLDDVESDDYVMTVTDFITPDTLFLGTVGQRPQPVKALPALFDSTGLEISQHFTTSKDGTRIPYFQVARKGLALNGANPTLLDGYGGFEVSELPRYSAVSGRAWLTQGGVLVLANIRGGGEYGPKWHQAALKQNRHLAYEDFAAVAMDLAARKITSPKHLGIIGGSNGGLLVGNMLTRYPELLGAVVCQVPLLDMQRYSHLLAGASWMAEYGDPDKPEEWKFIQTFSPYHNVKKGQKYPPTIFMTTTRDDRVHPGHARKMFAKMKDMGHDVRYFENTEGGHGAGADNRQTAHFWALAYTFLNKTLK